MGGNAPPDLPDRLYLHDPEGSYQVFTWLEATDWRWPPDVLLRQPEALMEDLVQISWLARRVEKHVEKPTQGEE